MSDQLISIGSLLDWHQYDDTDGFDAIKITENAATGNVLTSDSQGGFNPGTTVDAGLVTATGVVTTNVLSKWSTGAAKNLIDSSITDSGTRVDILNPISINDTSGGGMLKIRGFNNNNYLSVIAPSPSTNDIFSVHSTGTVKVGDGTPAFQFETEGNTGAGYFGVSTVPNGNGDILQIDTNGNLIIGTGNLSITTGQLLLPDGTAALPALAFTSDPNTGIYHHASNADEMFLVTGGVAALSIDASQNLIAPANLTVNSDSDTALITLGSTKIFNAAADQMSIAHFDHASLTNYSLRQTNAGRTILNSAAGQVMSFRINNSGVASFSSTGLFTVVEDIVVNSDDGAASSIFGTTKIFNPTTDQMGIAHFDHATATNYSIRQTSAGRTLLNSAAGQILAFRINNTNVGNFTADGIFSTFNGRRVATTRFTSGPQTITIIMSHIYCNTSAGAYTITLPPGVNGQTFRIHNTSTTGTPPAGSTLTIAPDGTELLDGVNASKTLAFKGVLDLTYETTEGWR